MILPLSKSLRRSMAVHEDFKRILEEHGYGFQYAVLKRAQERANRGESPWRHPVEEFPVRIQTRSTHIDFVLWNSDWPALLIAECKRVDPDRRWGFARSPYGRRRTSFERVFVDPEWLRAGLPFKDGVRIESERDNKENVFHIGFEIGGDKHPLKDAIAQALTGANGVLETLKEQSQLIKRFVAPLSSRHELTLVPVIFTTARLLATSVDLSSVNIETGRLPEGDLQADEVPWLFLTVNQSVDLKHGQAMSGGPPRDLAELTESWYQRTIAVVNPDGIDAFLGMRW